MSPTIRKGAAGKLRGNAPLFAALEDETRLTLLIKLGDGSLFSITQLTEGSTLTRQAITKYLFILHYVRILRGIRRGRENLFQMEPKSFANVRNVLDGISRQWDQSLARLKSYVED